MHIIYFQNLPNTDHIAAGIELLHQVDEGTPEGEELALLLVLVKDYEDKHFHIPQLDPIEVIKLKMDERGMKAKDLDRCYSLRQYPYGICAGGCSCRIGRWKFSCYTYKESDRIIAEYGPI